MKKAILLIVFSSCTFFLCAQESSLDSLKKELKIAKQDTSIVKLKVLIGMEESVLRISFWDSLVQESHVLKQYYAEAGAYIYLGYTYFTKEKQNEAKKYWKKALEIAEAHNDYENGPAAANNLAYLYEQEGAISNAIELYFKSLGFLDKVHDENGKSSIYNNLASIYFDLGDIQKTYDYVQKSIDIRLRTKDSTGLATSLNNMGYFLQSEKQYASALAYYDKALVVITAKNLTGLLPNTLYNIGTILFIKGDLERATEKLNECYDLYERNQNKGGQASALSSLAEIDMKKGDYANAIKKAEQALSLARKLGFTGPIKQSSKVLYEAYKHNGNDSKALGMYELFTSMKDSISKEENQKAGIQREMKYMFDNKAIADSVRNVEKVKLETQKHEQEIKQQKIYTYGGVVGFLLMLLVAGISFRAFKQKQKTNIIIEEQKIIVEEKQKEIVDSINYAKRIQYAMLAQDETLKTNLNEYFVLFQPKDIVSGDFYWATKKDSRFYLAVCDSTGHGVPGAFMSLLNISFLNEAITEKNIKQPNEILNHVRKRLIENISQEGAQDGMDGVLVCFENDKITYSAAHNPPVIIQNSELKELGYDKMPIGKGEIEKPFTLFEIDGKKGDVLYFYTDGYADQFGGKSGKKFKYKQLQELLLNNSNKDLLEQNKIYVKAINDWKGNLEQIDDILVVGIRL